MSTVEDCCIQRARFLILVNELFPTAVWELFLQQFSSEKCLIELCGEGVRGVESKCWIG